MTRSWTFQKKVSAGFAVMVALAAVTAAVAVYALRSVAAAKDVVISLEAQGLIEAARLESAANRQAAGFRGFVASPESRFLEEWNLERETFGQLLRRLQTLVRTKEGERLLAEIERAYNVLTTLQERGTALRTTAGGLEKALRLLKEEILPQRDRLAAEIKALVELKQRQLEEGRSESNQRAATARTLVISLAVAAVLFAAVTALLLARGLSRQIGSAVQHVQSSSAELQSSANQQAAGAKEATTAMNEVTTTMSELLATSRQIAESAQRVAQIAEQTTAAARGGDQTVAQAQESIESIRRQVDLVVGHMLELGKKSQQIGGILDIINELAEQTNILSINATIEAAGAGEQGKRFAVVGDEIRRLADRVAGSTKDVRRLVEEIRGAVNTTVLATEGGSKAVDSGLRSFAEVTRGFKEIAGLVVTTTQAAREIELSTKQQMTAVEQVNSAIAGAAQASRETEASTAQTLNTATQLAQLSRALSQIVQPHVSV